MLQFAISPVTKVRFETCLERGHFTEAYEIWNKAAERHLALQLKSTTLPAKGAGKGTVPTFKTQPLAANGIYRVEAGAATAWRLRLSRFVRKRLELEAIIKKILQ